jgi:hypothetical protein
MVQDVQASQEQSLVRQAAEEPAAPATARRAAERDTCSLSRRRDDAGLDSQAVRRVPAIRQQTRKRHPAVVPMPAMRSRVRDGRGAGRAHRRSSCAVSRRRDHHEDLFPVSPREAHRRVRDAESSARHWVRTRITLVETASGSTTRRTKQHGPLVTGRGATDSTPSNGSGSSRSIATVARSVGHRNGLGLTTITTAAGRAACSVPCATQVSVASGTSPDRLEAAASYLRGHREDDHTWATTTKRRAKT